MHMSHTLDAGNLQIPDDTSTETEACLESNEEEEKRGGMSKRGGLEGVAGECGQRGRGIPDMDAVVGILSTRREGEGAGEGMEERGRASTRLARCCKYACKESSIFVPLPHMKHKQAGEQGASLCGLKTELQSRQPKICM
jgi:hypothetical protein